MLKAVSSAHTNICIRKYLRDSLQYRREPVGFSTTKRLQHLYCIACAVRSFRLWLFVVCAFLSQRVMRSERGLARPMLYDLEASAACCNTCIALRITRLSLRPYTWAVNAFDRVNMHGPIARLQLSSVLSFDSSTV